MKKIIISLSLFIGAGFSAMAQDTEASDPAFTNKRGIDLLPQAGDFALGVDATPFLRYLGNIFTSGNNAAPFFDGVDQTIYGKYFLRNDQALRIRLSLNAGNDAQKGVVRNDEEIANNPLNANATVIDVWNYTYSDVNLGIGYEFRRGRGRVQGFYGGEVALGFISEKHKFDYANPMTAVNQSPSSFNFIGNASSASSRYTEMKPGMTFSAGLGAFAGVEYFFAPQMSIGGELALGLRVSFTGQTENTSESWNSSANSLQTQTVRNGKWDAQTISLLTSAYGGRIFLMFHF